MKKSLHPFNRITLSLFLTIASIYTIPYISTISGQTLYAYIAIISILGICAILQRAWVDTGIALFLVAALLIGRGWFSEVDETIFIIRASAILAFLFLHLTLLIGPWSRFIPLISRTYKHRRHIGVTTFLLSLLHAGTVMRVYFDYSFESAFTSTFILFGYTTFLILFWMAVTSWDIVQKKVPLMVWHVLHTGILVMYIGLVYYAQSVAFDMKLWHYWVIGTFIVTWIGLAPWSVSQWILQRVNGWKQLHLLIYIAYASLIIHVATGVLEQATLSIQALFWSLVGFVVLSHGVGRIRQLMQWKRRTQITETIQVDGTTYYKVGAVDNFENGKGKKVEIQNKSIAVFKNNDTFFGMSSICPHQGGPIDQGKIVNGYVECPWHKWQFSVTEGIGPKEYPDCIPYYTGLVQNGAVYISEDPIPNGQQTHSVS